MSLLRILQYFYSLIFSILPFFETLSSLQLLSSCKISSYHIIDEILTIFVKLQDFFLLYNWLHKNLFRAFNLVLQAHWSTCSCGTGLKCFLICIFLTSTIGVGFFYMITTLISAISSTSIVKLSLVVILFFLTNKGIQISLTIFFQFVAKIILKLVFLHDLQFCFYLLLKLLST